MAFKVTKKQLREQPGITIAFPYCKLQYILNIFDCDVYCSSRTSGWQCDFYARVLGTPINIVTGYSTAGCGAVDIPSDLYDRFMRLENRAGGNDAPFDEIRAELKALLNETHDYFVK